jgi:trimethylamine--corrinoid protein Co-methyltransferase
VLPVIALTRLEDAVPLARTLVDAGLPVLEITLRSPIALDAIREVGPGGHFLGCSHTQVNFKSAFWRSDLFDYKPFETWAEEGSRDTMQLANERVKKQLGDYQQPALDEGVREALDEYVAKKKASMPDAFI